MSTKTLSVSMNTSFQLNLKNLKTIKSKPSIVPTKKELGGVIKHGCEYTALHAGAWVRHIYTRLMKWPWSFHIVFPCWKGIGRRK